MFLANFIIKGKILKKWDVSIYRGLLTGFNEAYYLDEETKNKLIKAEPKAKEIIKPILRGRDVGRYSIKKDNQSLLFIPWHFPLHKDPKIEGSSKVAEVKFQKEFPEVFRHLEKFKKQLSARNQAETGIRYEWYALQRCAATYYKNFEKEKIIWLVLTDKPKFALDTEGYFCNNAAFILTGNNLKYLVAILNSKVSEWYFDKIAPSSGMGTNKWEKVYIEQLPIIDGTPNQHQLFSDRVEKILSLKKKNHDTTTLEKEIDAMVYKLYELSYEEVKIIDKDFWLSEEEYEKIIVS